MSNLQQLTSFTLSLLMTSKKDIIMVKGDVLKSVLVLEVYLGPC